MQVQAVRPGHASVRRADEWREVRTALVGNVEPGDWLLVFLDDARERLSEQRAAEIEATLSLVQAALLADAAVPADDRRAASGKAVFNMDAAFELPSASWTLEKLEAFK